MDSVTLTGLILLLRASESDYLNNINPKGYHQPPF